MDDVLVISQQRTGSNLLCYALSFFENYRNINEFYSVDSDEFIYNLFFTDEERSKFFKLYETKDWKILLKKIHENPIDAFYNLKSIDSSRNKIIKLLDHQFERNNKLYSVLDNFTKFIILERSDSLEQYVSLEIAEQNKIWWNQNTNKYKIHLDIDSYSTFCKKKKMFYSNIKEQLKDKNCIILNYEEHLSNGITDDLLTTLQGYLTNSPNILDKDRNVIKKQSTVNCSEKILNYENIKSQLHELRF